MSRWLWTVGGGTAVYLVMVASLDPWAVLQGLLISAGAAAVAGTRAKLPRGAQPQRWRPISKLPDLLVRQVVTGSLQVGAVALGIKPLPRGAWVELAYGERPGISPAAIGVLTTWSPGTYLLAVDEERRTMTFHLFDERDEDEFRRRHRELLEDGGGEEET